MSIQEFNDLTVKRRHSLGENQHCRHCHQCRTQLWGIIVTFLTIRVARQDLQLLPQGEEGSVLLALMVLCAA